MVFYWKGDFFFDCHLLYVWIGGYVFFETSSVQQLPGIEAKAWLKSPVYRATTPTGNCFRFAVRLPF